MDNWENLIFRGPKSCTVCTPQFPAGATHGDSNSRRRPQQTRLECRLGMQRDEVVRFHHVRAVRFSPRSIGPAASVMELNLLDDWMALHLNKLRGSISQSAETDYAPECNVTPPRAEFIGCAESPGYSATFILRPAVRSYWMSNRAPMM